MGRNKGISEVVAENGAATTFAQSGILLGHHRHFLWTFYFQNFFRRLKLYLGDGVQWH